MITISGKTFDHRDTLKDMGARWNADDKTWTIERPSARDLSKLRKLPGVMVSGIGKETPSRPKPQTLREAIDAVIDGMDESKTGNSQTNIHGDDRSYFNYFAGQNPISYFGFSSLSAVVKFIKNIPKSIQNETTDRRNDGWTGPAHWCGSKDMKEALHLATNGWPKGVELAEEITEHLVGRHAIQRRRKHSVAGGSVNVGRMLASNPKHMIARPKQDGKKVITLFVDCGNSASISPEYMIIRAAMVAAIADILEMNGYSCEIISIFSAMLSNRTPMIQIVATLKAAGETLNLNDIVFALGHPSYLRRMLFAVAATDERLRRHWGTMGQPDKLFTKQHPTAPNELHIAKISHEQRRFIETGGSVIDTAFSIWDIITDNKLPIELNREE